MMLYEGRIQPKKSLPLARDFQQVRHVTQQENLKARAFALTDAETTFAAGLASPYYKFLAPEFYI